MGIIINLRQFSLFIKFNVENNQTKPPDKLNENLKLHMIGKLQSNKAKDAVKLFDYIHSVDNQKLADVLAKHQKNFNKSLKYFILKIIL